MEKSSQSKTKFIVKGVRNKYKAQTSTSSQNVDSIKNDSESNGKHYDFTVLTNNQFSCLSKGYAVVKTKRTQTKPKPQIKSMSVNKRNPVHAKKVKTNKRSTNPRKRFANKKIKHQNSCVKKVNNKNIVMNKSAFCDEFNRKHQCWSQTYDSKHHIKATFNLNDENLFPPLSSAEEAVVNYSTQGFILPIKKAESSYQKSSTSVSGTQKPSAQVNNNNAFFYSQTQPGQINYTAIALLNNDIERVTKDFYSTYGEKVKQCEPNKTNDKSLYYSRLKELLRYLGCMKNMEKQIKNANIFCGENDYMKNLYLSNNNFLLREVIAPCDLWRKELAENAMVSQLSKEIHNASMSLVELLYPEKPRTPTYL